MDYILPGSSAHVILQARILEWVAISFSRESFWPKNRTQVSCIVDRFFTNWATSEAPYFSIYPFLLYACLEITQSTFSLPFKILHPIIISTPTPPDPEAAHIAKDRFLLWVRV